MLQSKHRAIVTNAPCCISNMQIHESLAVLFFRPPHHSTDWEFRLKAIWYVTPISLVSWKAFVLIAQGQSEVTYYCDNRRRHVSKPVETVRNKATKSVVRLVFHALVDYPDWAFVWFSSVSSPEYSYKRGGAFIPPSWGHQPKCPPPPTNAEVISLSELNPQTSIEGKLSFHRTNCL
jgi:hypothetical protein